MSKIRRTSKWFGSNVAAALIAIGVEKLVGLVGGAAMLAILLRLLSKFRGVPQDWYITGAIFLGALVLIVLSVVLTRRKTVRADLPNAIQEGDQAVAEEQAEMESFIPTDSSRECPDSWLHSIAQYDRAAIHIRVRVSDCRIWNRRFEENPREIVFNFDVINCSVYPILLEEAPKIGRIYFVKKALLHPPSIEASNLEISHGSTGWFQLCQQLTDGELARIRDAATQCAFQFDELNIMIKGNNGFEGVVTPKKLKIPFALSLDNTTYPVRS
jgi:hypothetical protein